MYLENFGLMFLIYQLGKYSYNLFIIKKSVLKFLYNSKFNNSVLFRK